MGVWAIARSKLRGIKARCSEDGTFWALFHDVRFQMQRRHVSDHSSASYEAMPRKLLRNALVLVKGSYSLALQENRVLQGSAASRAGRRSIPGCMQASPRRKKLAGIFWILAHAVFNLSGTQPKDTNQPYRYRNKPDERWSTRVRPISRTRKGQHARPSRSRSRRLHHVSSFVSGSSSDWLLRLIQNVPPWRKINRNKFHSHLLITLIFSFLRTR